MSRLAMYLRLGETLRIPMHSIVCCRFSAGRKSFMIHVLMITLNKDASAIEARQCWLSDVRRYNNLLRTICK
jgi:hypothetical protein